MFRKFNDGLSQSINEMNKTLQMPAKVQDPGCLLRVLTREKRQREPMRPLLAILCAACALLMIVPARRRPRTPRQSGPATASRPRPPSAQLHPAPGNRQAGGDCHDREIRNPARDHQAGRVAGSRAQIARRHEVDAATPRLSPYQRNSELMSEVDGLLKYIKTGREEAEEQLKEEQAGEALARPDR